jgi:UDP-N-acetylmuramate--alanine ligase
VGIGGAGMSGLAMLALRAGYRVSGTDRDESATLAALRAAGADARAGHDAAAIPPDAGALVVSTAIPPENPELLAARRRGLEVIHRADLLAELMAGRRGLAVAGAHGKSTTTAMLALALGDPAVCVGASIPWGEGTGASWGTGPWFVAEADESDRSLLRLAPEAAILLNVDHDHHATYASVEEVEQVFAEFVARLPADGLLVAGPNARARAVAAAAPCPVRLVGPVQGAWGWPEDGPAGPVLALRDGRRVPLRPGAPGRHNLDNAACALALADWCGVPLDQAAARIAGFGGVGRRFEERGTAAGVRVVDDYAHHPAEVAAVLAAARSVHPGRLVAVFQPHLYSRTRALGAETGRALGAADLVVVTDVYAAREAPVPGVSGRLVADAVPAGVEVRYVPALADVAPALVPDLRAGDLVLTIGAGDVTGLGQELLTRLENPPGDARDPHGGEHG